MSLLVRMAVSLAMALAAVAAHAQVPQRLSLSVLTYNVEGLPWPIRYGRSSDAQRIAARLQALRASGNQPRVIVLQEAFTPAAKSIALTAGYRYIADGPSRDDRGEPAVAAADKDFVTGASALSGETVGKWADSGLRIASDFPILSVRRMAFPAYACAGYDCLANKGAVAVSIAVPGSPQPVVIVATHLNSRAAAGVPFARSLYAFRRQLHALNIFIGKTAPRGVPVIVAGDFNAGQDLDRRDDLLRSIGQWRPGAPVSIALDDCLPASSCRKENDADILFSYRRGRDWQFYSAGSTVGMRIIGISAVFGHDADGAMLSDHVGYVATYGLATDRIPPPTRLAWR